MASTETTAQSGISAAKLGSGDLTWNVCGSIWDGDSSIGVSAAYSGTEPAKF